jgi:hypothetical protein
MIDLESEIPHGEILNSPQYRTQHKLKQYDIF